MLKRFLLNTLSSFVGTWIALGLFLISAVLMVIVALANFAVSDSMSVATVKKGSVLVIDLNGAIEEREAASEPDIQSLLAGGIDAPQTLDVITESIKEAAKNDDVRAIYLKCGNVSAGGATLDAIRRELIDFKKEGKKIYAYGDNMSQGAYFVASVADKVMMNPAGQLDLHGMQSTNLFFKGLFDKLGIQFQVMKVGTFKSAVEPYILENMSDPARAQLDTLFGNMWLYIREQICQNRKSLKPQRLDSIVNKDILLFQDAEFSVKSGLVDTLIYERCVDQYIADKIGVEKKKLNYINPSTLVNQTPWTNEYNSKNRIAVVFASGEIADGNDNAINYENLVPVIVDLADDEHVKGMVLRVNSPGGSVYGSTQIGEALDYFQSKGKPLAVSMGDYAASGGYWISAKADRIFADPLTITGSIGIFGLVPNAEGALDKLGINVAMVSTDPDASFAIGFKPLNEKQMQAAQANVERGYSNFTTRVAEGRKMNINKVLQIAEGRVWCAESALKIGLVDELGYLNNAVEWVAKKADIESKYNLAAYPVVEPTIWNMIQLNGISMADLKTAVENHDQRNMELYIVRRILSRNPFQARMPEFKVYL